MKFFVGIHHPSDCVKVALPCVVSVNVLRKRKSGFEVGDWIMDSGAFSTLLTHSYYPHGPEEYAEQVERWKDNGNLLAAVTQDYMCETGMLAKTGMTVERHQELTIERYDALSKLVKDCHLMPVLQGDSIESYVRHLSDYGKRITRQMWVGVGSMCRRGKLQEIEDILLTIKRVRPDILLHGFGLKTRALRSGLVRHLLWSADSMSWSYACRREGRAEKWYEAKNFSDRISNATYQRHLIPEGVI